MSLPQTLRLSAVLCKYGGDRQGNRTQTFQDYDDGRTERTRNANSAGFASGQFPFTIVLRMNLSQ